jgi:hypothetical protein
VWPSSAPRSTAAASEPINYSSTFSASSPAPSAGSASPSLAVVSVTEITLVGGERLYVEGEAERVEALILAAARGSIPELAWLTEARTGERVGVNPDHVLTLRSRGDPAG